MDHLQLQLMNPHLYAGDLTTTVSLCVSMCVCVFVCVCVCAYVFV